MMRTAGGARVALRVLGVVGMWAALSFAGPAAQAHHSIVLTECAQQPTQPPSSPAPSGEPSPTPSETPPPDNCIPASGSRLTGTVNLAFEVRANASRPIRQVDLYILSSEEGVPSPNDRQPVLSRQFPNSSQAPSSQTFSFAWDTASLTPYNGTYKILVTAQTHGPHPDGNGSTTQAAERRDLHVDNPPSPVAAPRVVATSAEAVSVEWDPASEPDVLSYALYRAVTESAETPPDYGQFTQVHTVSETSVRDPVGEEGVYWYTVIVTRRSVVTPETGISSAPSPISSAATVKKATPTDAPKKDDKKDDGKTGRVVPFKPRVVSRLPRLTLPRSGSGVPPVPDAPFSAVLPYDVPEGGELEDQEEPGAEDPRGPVLPVAVGAFLVSSALALGRMPY